MSPEASPVLPKASWGFLGLPQGTWGSLGLRGASWVLPVASSGKTSCGFGRLPGCFLGLPTATRFSGLYPPATLDL